MDRRELSKKTQDLLNLVVEMRSHSKGPSSEQEAQLIQLLENLMAGLENLSVTDLKPEQRDSKLEETRLRMKSDAELILDTAPLGILIADREGRLVFVNPSAAEMFGYRRDELLGQALETLLPDRLRGAHATHRAGYFAAPRPRRMGYGLGLGLVGKRKDGSEFPAEIGLSFVTADDRPLAVSFVNDISERTRMEEQLQLHAQQQAAVSAFNLVALRETNMSLVMQEAVTGAVQVTKAECGAVLELLPGSAELLLRSGVGWREGDVGRAHVVAGLSSHQGYTSAGYTLHTPDVVISDDLSAESRFVPSPLLKRNGVVSSMTVVIPGPHQPFGVLGVYSFRPHAFSPAYSNFLQNLANSLATAIQRQRAQETILMLSTPVLPVREQLLVVPLVGTVDRNRVQQLSESLLAGIRTHRAKLVLLDVTGVSSIAADVLNDLLRVIESARLMGARAILSGISDDFSKALAVSGVNLSTVVSLRDLRSGIEYANQLLARGRVPPGGK